MRTKSVTNSTISQRYHQGKTLDKRTNKRAVYRESTVHVYVQIHRLVMKVFGFIFKGLCKVNTFQKSELTMEVGTTGSG